METTAFVKELKQTMWDIEGGGGDPTLHVAPNHSLLKALRKEIFDTNKDRNLDDSRMTPFEVLLSSDRFEQCIRSCIVRLREFDIPEDQYFDILLRAFKAAVDKGPSFGRNRKQGSLKDRLLQEVSDCFQPWYYPTRMQCYDLALEHQLIYFEYRKQAWKLSNLGTYFLDLPTFEAIIFFCALEVVLSRPAVADI